VWRSKPLPPAWQSIRAKILNRDGHLCTTILQSTGRRCNRPGNEVDHIIPAWLDGGDDISNLATICTWHHRMKTASEGGRAKAASAPRLRLDPEAHPSA
jgi:5-methylcytosine-specific restriction protein A